jgi:hypothetical protein
MRVHAPARSQKSDKEAETGFPPLGSCLIDP